jgi:hypothetical protein
MSKGVAGAGRAKKKRVVKQRGSARRSSRAPVRTRIFGKLSFYITALTVVLLLALLANPTQLKFYQYQTTEGPKFGMTARGTPEGRQQDYTSRHNLAVSEPGKIKTWNGAAANEVELKDLDRKLKARLEVFRKARIGATEVYDAAADRVTHAVNVEILKHHALKLRGLVVARFRQTFAWLLFLGAAATGGWRAVRRRSSSAAA